MALNKEDINLINRYFDKELSSKEIEEFNKKIQQDPEFAEEINLRKEIEFQLHKVDEYEKSKDLVYSLISEKQSIFRNSWTYVAIAASIAFLIGIYVLLKPTENGVEDILITEEITDSNNFITPQFDELEYKADQYFYEKFKINSGQIIEIGSAEFIHLDILKDSIDIADTSQKAIYLTEIYIYKTDQKIDTLLYFTSDNISKGKYIYLKDTIVDAKLFWHAEAKETGDDILILTENIRIKNKR